MDYISKLQSMLHKMEDIPTDPLIINVQFYWEDGMYPEHPPSFELAEYLMSWIYTTALENQGILRCMAYFKYLFDESIYIEYPYMNPFKNMEIAENMFEYDTLTNIMTIKIPPQCIPPNMCHEEFIDAFVEYKSLLADTLWESDPGSVAVHYSGTAIDFDIV